MYQWYGCGSFLDIEVPEVFDVLGVFAGGFAEEGGDTGDKGAV